MTYSERFSVILAFILIFIGSSALAGLWAAFAFWHAKQFFKFLP